MARPESNNKCKTCPINYGIKCILFLGPKCPICADVVQLKPFNLKQCLFGEHLVKHWPDYPVVITESEKSAIIASAFFPEYIWLATGQKNGLSVEKFQVLSGRKVILYLDLGAYDVWNAKAREIRRQLPSISITTDDSLEENASETDREKGLDIVDYLNGTIY